MSRRKLYIGRMASQLELELDAKGYATAAAYGGKKLMQSHTTKTTSKRVGRRASLLRSSAVLRYVMQDENGRVVACAS